MRFLQFVIAAAVLFSNVRWQWTPNGYLAAIIAGVAVWLLTVFPFRLLAWARQLKAWLRQEKLHNGIAPRSASVKYRR